MPICLPQTDNFRFLNQFQREKSPQSNVLATRFDLIEAIIQSGQSAAKLPCPCFMAYHDSEVFKASEAKSYLAAKKNLGEKTLEINH